LLKIKRLKIKNKSIMGQGDPLNVKVTVYPIKE